MSVSPIPVPVAPLVGTLPPVCEHDIRVLGKFVRNRVRGEESAPPAAASDFREVFLTGATGFVGGFLLRDLLQRDEIRVVHCLVRAADSSRGLERVRATLQQMEVWDNSFQPRIRVWAGDLGKSRFGLGHADFAGLCECIDAVYHAAAQVNLVGSYANVRERNTMSLRQVLDLCLRIRRKHLFYVSSLGVFPEYFCAFSKEFQDSRIETQMQPDLETMKRVFPLGVSGYPWSKLTAEQILLQAQRAGLPVAIFRLPQTGNSTTGFTKADDLKVRLTAAMIDVGARPYGSDYEWGTEAVDVHTKAIVDISLNSHRKYTIYHCYYPRLLYGRAQSAEEFGIYLREVSYAAFKRMCLAKGAASPLYRLWPLLDTFAPYWFSHREPGASQPICDRAMQEDCPTPIKWPGPLTMLQWADDWLSRHQHEWPYPIPVSILDFDRLMAEGERIAQRQGISSDAVFPDWLRTGLKQLVTALQAPQCHLLDAVIPQVVLELTNALRSNVRLVSDRFEHPGIAEMEISQPVFIVGAHRTGTTLLHRLLARDPRFRTLQLFEMSRIPPLNEEKIQVAGTEDDPWVQSLNDALEASGMTELFANVHQVDLHLPEEEIPFLKMSFHSWSDTVSYRVPSFVEWLVTADMSFPYRRHHLGNLQHHAYVDQLRGTPQRQWLLKMPFHMMHLDALIQTYPDALFIQMHRLPTQFMGSWNSLVALARSRFAESGLPHDLGIELLDQTASMMNIAIEFRQAHPELEHRWLDLSYYDLVRDPMAATERVYGHFGWNLEARALKVMNDWLIQQAEQRRSLPRHQYDLADYGLTLEDVDKAFAQYRQFIVDRGIFELRI